MSRFPGSSSSSSRGPDEDALIAELQFNVRFHIRHLKHAGLRDAHSLVVDKQRALRGWAHLLTRHCLVYENMYKEASEAKNYDCLFEKFLDVADLRREVSEASLRLQHAIKSYGKISDSVQDREDYVKLCLDRLLGLGIDVSQVPKFGSKLTLPPPLPFKVLYSGMIWEGYSSTRRPYNRDRDVWASCLGHHANNVDGPLGSAWERISQSDCDKHRVRNPDLSSGSWTCFNNTSHEFDDDTSDDPGSSDQKNVYGNSHDQGDTPPKTSARPKPAAPKPLDPYDDWHQ